MAIKSLPDLTGTRIQRGQPKEGWPGAIELVCDRPLGLAETVRLPYMPKLHHLGMLAGTDIGEALLELATGDTTGDIVVEDVLAPGYVGCISISPPRVTATLADLLDDIRRLANLPASKVNPKNQPAVLAGIAEAFNKYLAVMEQGWHTLPAIGCGGVSARGEQSLLWTYFDTCLTRRGEITLTPELLVRYMRRAVPWMGELLAHLVEKGVITGGDIATSVASNGMRLFSLPVSAANPTPEDCLELIVTAAEKYAGYKPTEKAIVAMSRHDRWRKSEPPLTDRLACIRWRWSLVLQELARQAGQG